MAFPIHQNDRLALAASILQKLSEIYPTKSEPDLREAASNMEHFAFRDAADRSSYLQNVANIIKREQSKAASAAQYNNVAIPPTAANTSSSTTHPATATAAALQARRARPQSVANGNVNSSNARPRSRAGRPRSTSAVANSKGASAGPGGVANNNPNFANMGNANRGIMTPEMMMNLQRQHQRNAQQQQQQQQQALAIRQQQHQQALAYQQARIRKHAMANGLNQAQMQALMSANPMFNVNGNAQIPLRRTPATALPQQAHPVNRSNNAHHNQQPTRQPAPQQIARQNAPAAVPANVVVQRKLITFFKTYKDDFNIIVSHLPAFVNATDKTKQDIVKRRLRAAHTLFEAIRSNRVPVTVTEELVDGHSKFMAMVITWFKRTHPNIFVNRNAVPANANLAVNASQINQQPQRPAPSNQNAASASAPVRANVHNVQNNTAPQQVRPTAVAQASAHAQAKAAEQARLLQAQRQRVAKAQLEARRVQQLASQQVKAATTSQPITSTAPALVQSDVGGAAAVKSKGAPVAQVPRGPTPANEQKKLPVSNPNRSPAGISKNRPASTKVNPGTGGATGRGTQKMTKEKYQDILKNRVNVIHQACENIEKVCSQQAIAAEKALLELKKKRARHSILSLQKFMKETREAVYGKEENIKAGGGGDNMVRAEKKFVCTSEGGLFIAEKKSSNSSSKTSKELTNLRQVVIADCRAALAKNGEMEIDVKEEFGLPMVECQLLIAEMKMPKLVIRVQRGYPTVSAVTYRLSTPPLGWTGTMEKARASLRRIIYSTPVESGLGVASIIDAWAKVAQEVVQSENSNNINTVDASAAGDIDVGIMA